MQIFLFQYVVNILSANEDLLSACNISEIQSILSAQHPAAQPGPVSTAVRCTASPRGRAQLRGLRFPQEPSHRLGKAPAGPPGLPRSAALGGRRWMQSLAVNKTGGGPGWPRSSRKRRVPFSSGKDCSSPPQVAELSQGPGQASHQRGLSPQCLVGSRDSQINSFPNSRRLPAPSPPCTQAVRRSPLLRPLSLPPDCTSAAS